MHAQADIGTESPRASELQEKLEEFMNYITSNVVSIPNYADRHRHGEPIATGFVESAVNQVVSKLSISVFSVVYFSIDVARGEQTIANTPSEWPKTKFPLSMRLPDPADGDIHY